MTAGGTNGFAWGTAGGGMGCNVTLSAGPSDRFGEALFWLMSRGYAFAARDDELRLLGPGLVPPWIEEAVRGYLPVLHWLVQPQAGSWPDPYAVLGLSPTATPAAVKERYRAIMQIVHPDKHRAGLAPTASVIAAGYNRAYAAIAARWSADEQAG